MDSWIYEHRVKMTMIIAVSLLSGYLWGRYQGYNRGHSAGFARGQLVNAAFVVSEIAQKIAEDSHLDENGNPSLKPLTKDQFADIQALLRVDRLIQKANK